MPTAIVQGFHDARTSSVQYVVACSSTGRCAIVDPVLDYDERSGSLATTSADALLAHVRAHGQTVEWILDTHPHADHLSAAAYLKRRTGAPVGTGARIPDVQALWADIYAWTGFPCDGSQWDRLFADEDTFAIGDMPVRVMHSPGHTLASVSFVVGDAAFVHDTLFMPDTGTARTDFPGGSAAQLHASIGRILALPDATRLFVGHDYGQGGRAPAWESTVAEQKADNIHVGGGVDLEDFVALREARDRTLPMPRLILHALQVNINAGRLPEKDAAGRRFLVLPLDALPAATWG